ncbi:hypothetical protein FOB58_000668 [Candida parapsilosis]|uniref:Autophagy-related protein 101 n=2 Tax=Candida parapsilosis TaxID=5480 RepID=G8BCV9_CANPC|nr:uncharacterized protein CPAR2_207470 [Candida parapsilosis]KAF6054746.1 hypothetical protein FOB58_000668 [Candida parapsilosis]KAF6056228.1 hypothetical protein FOB59_000740 [Candida parapsilosis]KAF6059161.1 hypothetical protein FOB60_000743 [Candida parapsilosis]KAF6067918.1 hypothetical protein FOB61_000743 [Candida parapsilosis]CAD1808642.1 unnamed protein product [Candida parapsilosis]
MQFVIDLVAERSVLKESIKGVIWTIFFNRLFGPITPTTREFLDVTYPSATNLPELESLIEEKVSSFIRTCIESKLLPANGTITIQFLNKSNAKRKSSGWFGREYESDDIKPWEKWTINVESLPIEEGPTIPRPKHSGLEYSRAVTMSMKSFEAALISIYDFVDRNKEHIPPITSLESSPFPYAINIEEDKESKLEKPNSDGDEGWGSYIKKILD